jgi:hypothetical protein
MMGLQVGAAALLLLLSLLRFHSMRAGRKQKRATWLARLRQRRWRFWPRPACGDNPVLWKELHTSPLDGLARIFELAGLIPLLVFAAVGVYFLARPAAQEALVFGYGSLAHDYLRLRFNLVLRGVFLSGFLILFFVVTGYGASSIAVERTSTTWPSLMATALEGRAILRAKRWGAIWRARLLVELLAGGAFLGLVCGAVHPLGFLATMALMAAGLWFCAALGTYCSLTTTNLRQSSNGAVGILFLLIFSAAAFWALPPAWAAAPVAAGSLPFTGWLSLLSYPDFRALARGAFFTPMQVATIARSVQTWGLVITYFISLLGYIAGAVFLVRAAERTFDRHVGRPFRDPKALAGEPAPVPHKPIAHELQITSAI